MPMDFSIDIYKKSTNISNLLQCTKFCEYGTERSKQNIVNLLLVIYQRSASIHDSNFYMNSKEKNKN